MTTEKKILFAFMFGIASTYTFPSGVLGDLDQYINIGGGSFDNFAGNMEQSILSQIGGGVNEVAGDVLGVCYDYKPAPLKKITLSIDICSAMNQLNIDDPCSAAPDLSSFGFAKSSSKGMDLKAFCENTVGKKQVYKLDDLVKNADFNKNLFSAGSPTDKTEKVFNETTYTLSDARKNQTLIDAIINNDVDTVNYFNNVLAISDNKANPSKIDISKINVAYETTEDFYKSAQAEVDAFQKLKEQLDINKFSQKILAAYNEVNNQTKDPKERRTQKNAIKGKLLNKEYFALVDRYVKIKIKQRQMLEYRQTIAMPTKEYVEQFSDEMKPKVVAAIEFQKMQLSKIVSEVQQEGNDFKYKATNAALKADIATDELDDKATMAQIDKLVNSTDGSTTTN